MTRNFNAPSNPTSPITRRGFFFLSAACGFAPPPAALLAKDIDLPNAKPVPKLQSLPLPHDQISFTRDGVELTRYHFGPGLRRPFLHPVNGPSGRSLTRMGHPQDPAGHSHHNSVWFSHHDVNGVAFWGDKGEGRILHQRTLKLTDADQAASALAINHWIGKDSKPLLIERRGTRIVDLADGEYLIILDAQFETAGNQPVAFGKTPFGLIGVRMAKTIGVADGGGTIRNSEGNIDEKGDNGCFWKKARWCDYSGPITPTASEGIALFDHPANPNHPTVFHVRVDGWMGACFTFDAPFALEPGRPLKLRYGLYVHRGVPRPAVIDAQWDSFAKTGVNDPSIKR